MQSQHGAFITFQACIVQQKQTTRRKEQLHLSFNVTVLFQTLVVNSESH